MTKLDDSKEAVFFDGRVKKAMDVNVRIIGDISAGPKTLTDNIYFEGMTILRCYTGRMALSFNDRGPIKLGPGEVVVVYPHHFTTIKMLAAKNRCVYGIFDGSDVEAYFNELGFFDCIRGETTSHFESIVALREGLEKTGATKDGQKVVLGRLTDILRSQAEEMRMSGSPVVFDAIKRIHRNLAAGVVQVKELCSQLGVSRVYLHRAFTAAGYGKPSDFIREQQMRLIKNLLRDIKLPLSEVARKGGFFSAAHFTTFVKRATGLTPTQLRRTLASARDGK